MAGFSKGNNYLGALIENSADAQSNLYILEFSANAEQKGEEGINSITSDLQLRTKSFDWTPPSQDQYEVKFLTAKINRPTAFVKVTHNFSFTVRVDAQYDVYSKLLAQQKITFNPEQHWALNDINSDVAKNSLFDLKVNVATGSISSSAPTFNTLVGFNGCWITAIDPIAFKTGEPGPVEVKVTCAFKYLWDQWNRGEVGSTTTDWIGVTSKTDPNNMDLQNPEVNNKIGDLG